MMKTHHFSETTILYLTKYHSVLDQPYVKLEAHIEDLITLRLRCNYRKSNGKAIPDSYPLPKMQQILENLG